MTRPTLIGAILLGLGGAVAMAQLAPGGDRSPSRADTGSIERGRYLVQIGGCNDCHTPDYRTTAGNVAEERWLIGDSLGFNGPWGTTYPSNLRRFFRTVGEEGWLEFARHGETRPPMPWFNLRVMSEADLRALYRYVRSLPADDNPVPDYAPPGTPPSAPYDPHAAEADAVNAVGVTGCG